MRRILKTALLLAVLCLAGCSGDDPQSVAFSENELHTGTLGDIFTVNITANCPWSIRESSTEVLIQGATGEGSAPIRVNVAQNLSHDELEHVIVITSQDGTSSDTLTIFQQAVPGFFPGHVDAISEEGGTFSVPVMTNVTSMKIETPEWITETGSRAMDRLTYTFTAEPNKTGKVRTGNITFKGKELTGNVQVTQKAYSPTAIEITGLGEAITASETPHAFPVKVTPEYACTDNITVSTTAGKAYIKDGTLYIQSAEQGSSTIEFKSDGAVLLTSTVDFVSPELPLALKDGMEYCLGTSFGMMEGFPEKYAEISVSDSSVLVREEGGYAFRKEGTVTVSVRNTVSGKEAEFTVSGSCITFPSVSMSSIVVGSYSIVSYGVGIDMYDVSEYTVYTTYGDSTEKLGETSGTGNNPKGITSLSYSLPSFRNAEKGKIHVHVEAVISGEKKTRVLDL